MHPGKESSGKSIFESGGFDCIWPHDFLVFCAREVENHGNSLDRYRRIHTNLLVVTARRTLQLQNFLHNCHQFCRRGDLSERVFIFPEIRVPLEKVGKFPTLPTSDRHNWSQLWQKYLEHTQPQKEKNKRSPHSPQSCWQFWTTTHRAFSRWHRNTQC